MPCHIAARRFKVAFATHARVPGRVVLRQERTAAMPLCAFVHETDFEPELLASIGIAFAAACEALGLADKTD